MSRRSNLTLLVTLVALSLALVACRNRSGDAVGGVIRVTNAEKIHPIAQAQIKLTPLAPIAGAKGVDEQPEAAGNLRGVDTTNDTGAFRIASLSSDQTFQEYELLRNWTYQLQVLVPGYYIYSAEFPFESGTSEVEVTLKQKGNDVEDDSDGVQFHVNGVQMGSIRRHQ